MAKTLKTGVASVSMNGTEEGTDKSKRGRDTKNYAIYYQKASHKIKEIKSKRRKKIRQKDRKNKIRC